MIRCEITGLAETPDGKAMFINIQHPGENTAMANIGDPSRYTSHWPGNAGYGAGGAPAGLFVVQPKRLFGPGPSAQELATMVEAALRAPDHGGLLPWRLVEFPASSRAALADVFEAEKLRRDPLRPRTTARPSAP